MKSPFDSPSGNTSISVKIIQKVKSYFLENSCTWPGKKDVLIIYNYKKGKEKRQTHNMLTISKETYSPFKAKNLKCKICFSKFL